MNIGNRIKMLRTENNMTQKELSSKLGLTPKMVSFYETSQRMPPIDIILKLVTIFDVSSDYLLGLTNTNLYESNNITALSEMPDGAQILLETYKELIPQNQRTLLHTALSMLENQTNSKILKNVK
ncbi:helix-turn-helix transcriptional regulator [Lachnospiraceae bacterium JLR.KK008]